MGSRGSLEEPCFQSRPPRTASAYRFFRVLAVAAQESAWRRDSFLSITDLILYQSEIVKAGAVPVLAKLRNSTCATEAESAGMAWKRLMAGEAYVGSRSVGND